MSSQKCAVCNNITTNPSGRCYLHESSSRDTSDHRAPVSAAPSLSAGDGLDITLNNIQSMAMQDAASEFIETELGGEFDDTTLKVDPQGDYFTMEVLTGFEHRGQNFSVGDTVIFTDRYDPSHNMAIVEYGWDDPDTMSRLARGLSRSAERRHKEREHRALFDRLEADGHDVAQWRDDPSMLREYARGIDEGYIGSGGID